MANYFNSLPHRLKVQELGKCDFMQNSEFADGVKKLIGKKIVIIGCGAQGLAQGQNMRDSGLNVVDNKRASFVNATENGFEVGTFEQLIPTADLVSNLAPDKQHTSVVKSVVPLMKQGACLSYSHGFNIVEEGTQIRKDRLHQNRQHQKYAQNTFVASVFLHLLRFTPTIIRTATDWK